jgi:predicted lipoprotein
VKPSPEIKENPCQIPSEQKYQANKDFCNAIIYGLSRLKNCSTGPSTCSDRLASLFSWPAGARAMEPSISVGVIVIYYDFVS